MESLKLKNQSDNKYMISKTLPSAVHTGSSKGVNVRLQRTKEKESSEFERDSIETNEFQREREREVELVPAAIEGEAFEGGAGLFGLGAAPIVGPLRLRYEHPVFAVLLLPH